MWKRKKADNKKGSSKRAVQKKARQKNNLWENLQGFRYAHRGLFHQPRSASRKILLPFAAPAWREDIAYWKRTGRKIIPENSMRAFHMAVRCGFGSELDVHLTADGRLVVFHDTNLVRMTGIDRRVEEMTWRQLRQVRLLDTDCRIPLLEEVLQLYTSPKALTQRPDARTEKPDAGTGKPDVGTGKPDAGTGKRNPGTGKPDAKAGKSAGMDTEAPKSRGGEGTALEAELASEFLHLPLIIELKAEGNVSDLCRHVMEIVDRYPTLNYCIESFDPRVVYWLRRHRPDVIRGQLTENFMKSREAVRQWGHLMTFGMWSVAPDILSRPDFISSKFPDRKNIFILLSHRLGVRQVNWIIKSREELLEVEREGGLGIFERFIPDDR